MSHHSRRSLSAQASLALAFILAGCAATESCLTYACVNQATLSGKIALPDATAVLQIELCFEDTCETGTLDLKDRSAESGVIPTVFTNPDQSAYHSLSLLNFDAGTAEAQVTWVHSYDDATEPANGSKYRVKVTDAATGEVLLNVQRAAQYSVTREDNCHRCWGSEMTW
jgi:hypothetical protein